MPFVCTKDISPQIFRAYDIRGIVGETLTPTILYTLGRAIGTTLYEQQQSMSIITARDGRLSGPSLSAALEQGLCDSGCEVIDIAAVPSPVLYFATHTLSTRSGVILTGSHNPVEYNGLKIILNGCNLTEETVYALYQRIQVGHLHRGQGQIVRAHTIVPDYIQRICSDIVLQKPLRVVLDCGNGIPGAVAPKLLRQLGCTVIELFCDVDGNFPNHHPDPSVPENLSTLISAVAQHQADIGLALDGDGDRLGVVTNTGKIIWPDRQLMLYAIDILSRHPNATIVYDVKSTQHLAKVIRDHGGLPLMWKTGHSLLKAKMKEVSALLAGEMSGHIFFQERWYGFDDALYTAARLLELLAKDTRSSTEIFAALPEGISTPEIKIPISEAHKFIFMEQFIAKAKFANAQLYTLDGVRAEFSNGWGLLRASNTTPCLTARFEADQPTNLTHIQTLFKDQIAAVDPYLKLPF